MKKRHVLCCLLWSFSMTTLAVFSGHAQTETDGPVGVYQKVKKFALTGGMAAVENLELKRDRAKITFATWTLYFQEPVDGQVRGTVFLGRGRFRAEVPPTSFEKEHVRRMLKADVVESDFQTAVLRFTDDTFDHIGKGVSQGIAPSRALELARDFDPRFLTETGANVSARMAVSVLNREEPGFFVASFDEGKRGRFTFLLDHQGRVASTHFGIPL